MPSMSVPHLPQKNSLLALPLHKNVEGNVVLALLPLLERAHGNLQQGMKKNTSFCLLSQEIPQEGRAFPSCGEKAM